jgi:mannose-1-phosphate guanylyltransferase
MGNHRVLDSYASSWAIVLAGGQGTRLRDLTTGVNGISVPKQYCSLRGGACLLQEALIRAATVAPVRRLCAVVAAQHRRWWEPPLRYLPKGNIVVQPENRGTAFGILLPLLKILDRDPNANVVLLPADHHVLDEVVMARALRQAADLAATDRDAVILLGAEPHEADADLGYIVPAERNAQQPSRVMQFVEKPDAELAHRLREQGALWNVFIVAASGRTLLKLFQRSFASSVVAMAAALQSDRATLGGRMALSAVYGDLPTVDFSRDVLEGHESMLRVVSVPFCGWSDLGTPERVAETLRHTPAERGERATLKDFAGYLNLSAQHLELQQRRESPIAP